VRFSSKPLAHNFIYLSNVYSGAQGSEELRAFVKKYEMKKSLTITMFTWLDF